MPDTDPSLDTNTLFKVGDRGYAYSMYWPGKHRVVGLMDFGCFDESFIDEERATHYLRMIKKDFDLPEGDKPE